MTAAASPFHISTSLRVPGLGILALSAAPLPDWLGALDLHTTLTLQLHRPDQPPLALYATVEEVSHAPQKLTRALLLDADPDGELPEGSWLSLESVTRNELL